MVFLVFTISAIQMDTSTIAWNGYVLFYWEYLIINYLIFQGLQTINFFVMCTTILTIINAGHVIEKNRIVWKLIDKYRNDNSKLSSIPFKIRYRYIIANQLSEHNRVTYIVINSSHELFGYINYAFLLTNIPINVFILRRNLYEPQLLQDQILLWALTLFQLITFLIVFIPPSWCTKVYHSPAKFIPILQPMLCDSIYWIKYKMKYEDLYHRLIDKGPKLGLTIGPVRAITYMTSFEVK